MFLKSTGFKVLAKIMAGNVFCCFSYIRFNPTSHLNEGHQGLLKLHVHLGQGGSCVMLHRGLCYEL